KSVDPFALEEELEEEGSFNPFAYKTVAGFFDELTGDIQKTLGWGRSYFEYETYFYVYEGLISDYLSELIPERVFQNLSIHFK
ncbi:hypothetical protein, partial [Alkalibacillus haloalkaliphilus]|uniref:hypothetical protein n=1 Tax=Alkalibacillus haloalkaliphilus TaxID=94136 RepID=UPI002935C84E